MEVLKWANALSRQSYSRKYIFVAECPEVGTVSRGHGIEEAIANLREAAELYLEEFPAPRNPILS